MMSSDEIDYRFLNIDTEEFVESQTLLPQQHLMAFTDFQSGQVLITGSKDSIDERSAINMCRSIAYAK